MKSHPRWTHFLHALWVLCVVQAGAWLGHWLFHGSRALAEVAAQKQINAPINWLARHTINYDGLWFHRFGIATAAALAALPFLPLVRRQTKLLRPTAPGWAGFLGEIQRSIQCLVVCLLVAIALGFAFGSGRPTLPEGIWWMVIVLYLIAIPMELAFRGVFLPTGSRRSAASCLISTSLYLLVLLAFSAPGLDAWKSELSSDRFPIWRSLGQSFLWPVLLLDTVPLILVGLVCCHLRIRSSSLWLGIGAQAAFLLALVMGVPSLAAAVSTVIGSTVAVRQSRSQNRKESP